MLVPIPPRDSTRYAGQFEGAGDVERLFHTLRDALETALTSQVEETARSRYELALECYHQLSSLELPDSIQGKIQEFTEALVTRFPTAWRINAALGAVERASAAQRPEVQVLRLTEAREILKAGLTSDEPVETPELEALLVQVEEHLERVSGEEPAPMSMGPESESAGALVPVSSLTDEELAGEAQGASAPSATPPRISLDLGVLPRVHLAMLQERRAAVHSLVVKNAGAAEAGPLTLEVSSEPPFLLPSKLRMESLGAGEELDLGPRRIASFLTHDRGILGRLTERAEGTVTARVLDEGGAALAQVSAQWTLFPTDTWFGLGTLPELLAAYVLPNDPAVEASLSLAAKRLGKATDSPSLDGYQSKDPVRALRTVEAIYGALQDTEITYANPPASFETDGQRVRFPGQLISSRLGTCLDLALFAAAALEQAGLHPLIVVTEGHAFVGSWLVEETFSNPVVEEPVRLMKRVELTEIVLVDPTLVASRPSPDFEGARRAAMERLDDPAEFRVVIDVHRARLGGVLPLPVLESGAFDPSGSVPQEAAAPTKSARDLDAELAEYLEAERRRKDEEETPQTRLDRWLRQLLDLTMRNRLLNSASRSKRVLPLIPGELGAIEDRLAEGRAFRVLERPVELEKGAAVGSAERERIAPLLNAGVSSGELRSTLDKEDLDERLLTLYREARTAREEGGANSLYLALGFLEYRETKQSSKVRRAPLLLVPLDLRRKSARRGYSLVQGGDEPRVNVTLLEYLRRDHEIDVTGLDPLPMDEQGVDVPLLLRVFKDAIKDADGWEVLEHAEVGLYSFSKYLLWRDLKDRAQVLRQNELVEHLIERPSEPFPDSVEVPDPRKLDRTFSASEVFAPLSYDSSQLSAILAAADGKTMVLEGPPGTGKSQTITNLIAHAIAQGKTILFVSEKMAALDVVHRRLRHLGLGPACLELHSNKANKKAVLEQFKEALDEGRVRGARRRAWADIAADLDGARQRLNGHVEALHRTRPSGESVHGVISMTSSAAAQELDGWDLGKDLGIEDPRAVDEALLTSWHRLLDEIDVVALEQLVGPEHPLLAVGQTEYSPIFEAESLDAVRAFDPAAEEFLRVGRGALDALGAPDGGEPATAGGWESLARLLGLASSSYPGAASAAHWLRDDAAPEFVGKLVDLVDQHQVIVERTGARFRSSPATLDLGAIETLRREMAAGGWWTRWRRKGAILKELRSIAKEPGSVDIDAALQAVDDARRVSEIEQRLSQESKGAASSVLGPIWKGPDTNTSEARGHLESVAALQGALRAFSDAVTERASGAVSEPLAEALAGRLGDGRFAELAEELHRALASLQTAKEGLLGAAQPLVETGRGTTPLEDSLGDIEALQALSLAWADSWRGLRGWSRWQGLRKEACSAATDVGGLGQVILAIEAGRAVPGTVRGRFDLAFARSWALHEISADKHLRAFEGSDHARAQRGFRDLDDERLAAAREEIRQRIGSRRPKGPGPEAPKGAAAKTGLGLLQRELTKKTRHLAIRRLLHELGDAAMELKPCFLMSPMSVAQYLEAEHPPFDIVVFDEASQIPVWDAIGAIARGQQAVIVGDPKQLPPTSFFSRGVEEEDLDDDDVEDLESILEECIGARVPTHRLRWHYRSRHESLIAFSNERYYDSKLLTFPSGTSEGRGVRLRYLTDAVYDKGATRTNRVEAEAVAAEVLRRLQHPVLSGRTIGVVTFSQAQQNLVLDLLDAAQRRHPEIERFFDDGIQEPVFVKNLENVQGDERDVIIFSIGYGPDAAGRVSMNFGPLNNDGGERRLNVAITRAREEVLVHTSIRSEEIDLARTGARGVRDLRAFLAFAETAEREADASDAVDTASVSPDPLVAAIGAALAARGWLVDFEIGRSDVRVDLGIRHPERPDDFLAGLESDGLNYRRAATARDRDRLRSDVLEGLGWNLLRVWSVDWWRDSEGELDRIHRELQRLVDESAVAASEASHDEDDELMQPGPLEVTGAEAREDDPSDPTDEAPKRLSAAPSPAAPTSPPAAPVDGSSQGPYLVAEPLDYVDLYSEFYSQVRDRDVAASIGAIIEVEAPITEATLLRRAASAWGFSAVSKKFKERILGEAARAHHVTEHPGPGGEGQRVYWRSPLDPEAFLGFRTQADTDARSMTDVPQPEIMNAMLFALEPSGRSLEDLQRTVMATFGTQRLTRAPREAMEAALSSLQSAGEVHVEVVDGAPFVTRSYPSTSSAKAFQRGT